MEQILAYFIMIFGVLVYVSSTIAYRLQKAKMQLDIDEHNRKVMLGMKEADWSMDIDDDCIPDATFFLLGNSGTYDTSYLSDYEYISFINNDDLFLED